MALSAMPSRSMQAANAKPATESKRDFIATVKAYIAKVDKDPEHFSIEATVKACELESPDRIAKLIAYRDEEKGNLLHYLVKHPHAALPIFMTWKLHIGRETMLKWISQTSNIDGNPISLLIRSYNTSILIEKELYKIISRRTAADHLPGLTQLLDIDEIVIKFPEAKDNPEVLKLLQDCYRAVNFCRDIIKYSSTHPSIVRHKKSTTMLIKAKIDKVRENPQTSRLHAITAYEAGNCSEHADLAFAYFINNPSCYITKIERVNFSNGDHVFLLINRTTGDIQKPETWNTDTIVLDSWAGKVFFASHILIELMDYRQYNITERDEIVKKHDYFEYNPKYQKIQRISEMTFAGTTLPKTRDSKPNAIATIRAEKKPDTKPAANIQDIPYKAKKYFHPELLASLNAFKKKSRDRSIIESLCNGTQTTIPDIKIIPNRDFFVLYDRIIHEQLLAIDPRQKKVNYSNLDRYSITKATEALENLILFAKKNNLLKQKKYLLNTLEDIFITIFSGNYCDVNAFIYLKIETLIVKFYLCLSNDAKNRMLDTIIANINWKKPESIELLKKAIDYRLNLDPLVTSFKQYYSAAKIRQINDDNFKVYLILVRAFKAKAIPHFIHTFNHCNDAAIRCSPEALETLIHLLGEVTHANDIVNQSLIKNYMKNVFLTLCTGDVFPFFYHTNLFTLWENTILDLKLCASPNAKTIMGDNFILSIKWDLPLSLKQLEKIKKYQLNIDDQLFYLFDLHYTSRKINSLDKSAFYLYISQVNYFGALAIDKLIAFIKNNPHHLSLGSMSELVESLKPLLQNTTIPLTKRQRLEEVVIEANLNRVRTTIEQATTISMSQSMYAFIPQASTNAPALSATGELQAATTTSSPLLLISHAKCSSP